jgi:hypothetical protein
MEAAMNRRHRHVITATALVVCTAGSAWAFVVTDSATTARNAITAALKNHIVETVLQQRDRLDRMAARLSAVTSLERYRSGPPPTAAARTDVPFVRALNGADGEVATSYSASSRERTGWSGSQGMDALTQADLARQFATLDIADASALAAATQLALARRDKVALQRVLDELERDVLNAAPDQSATAVLDKLSASAVIEARQKQARLQMLAALAEQLLVDAKRTRDTEAGALNMQRNKVLGSDGEEGGLLAGAADDLRNWRQP